MFALDLFNTKYEQELNEGAVDNLTNRLLEPLSQQAAEIRTRLRNGNLTGSEIKALEQEYANLVAKRVDIIRGRAPNPEFQKHTPKKNEFDIKEPQDECMGYGGLVGEAGLPDVADKQAKMSRLNQPGQVGTDAVSPQQRVNPNPDKGIIGHAADWLRGKGGPGKEGPTYESELDEVDASNKPFELTAQTPESAGQAVYQQLIQAYKAEVPYVIIPFMEEQKQATLTKPSIFNALVALYQMNPNARKKAIEKNFSSFENFMLFVSRLKPYQYRRPSAEHRASVQQQTSPSPSPNPEPQTAQSGATQPNDRQWEPFKDLSEGKDQKKNSEEPPLTGTAVKNARLSRELTRARAEYPSAQSDIEALVMKDMDHADQVDNALQAQQSTDAKQDQNIQQLQTINRDQAQNINTLQNKLSTVQQQVQPVAQKPTAAPATTVPTKTPAVAPSIAPTTEPAVVAPSVTEPLPAEVAAQDAEARAEIARLNKQIQQLELNIALKKPEQQTDVQNKIEKLQSQVDKMEQEREAQRQQALANLEKARQAKAEKAAKATAARDEMDQLFGRIKVKPAARVSSTVEPVDDEDDDDDDSLEKMLSKKKIQPAPRSKNVAEPVLHEAIEPGTEMSTNELLYRAAVEYMQHMGREGQAVDFETAVKLAAKHYHIPYRPGIVPELYNKRQELDAKLAAAIAAKQSERANRKSKQLSRTAPTTPEQEKKIQDYWSKHAPRADRLKGAATSLEESQMAELDAMRQDLELMTDRQFYVAYGISKAAFQQRYRTLLNPAPEQDAPVKEGQWGGSGPSGLKDHYAVYTKENGQVRRYKSTTKDGKPMNTRQAEAYRDVMIRNNSTRWNHDNVWVAPADIDLDEGWKSAVAGAALAGATALGAPVAHAGTVQAGALQQSLSQQLKKPALPQPQVPKEKEKADDSKEKTTVSQTDVKEAGSPAQQAAIAIAMKKSHKKPKTEATADQFGQAVRMASQTGKHLEKDPETHREIRRTAQQVAQRQKNIDRERAGYGNDPDEYADIDEAQEIRTREDFIRQRDKLYRMIQLETEPANKQILKTAIRNLERRAAEEGWFKLIREENSTSSEAVEIAVIKRILVAHTNLIMEFGLDKVTQAIEEVAYNVGDVDEIGTSDVSAWVRQVEQILGVPEELDEKWSQKYKRSIDCSHPKGFSQRAHCAGRKK